LMSLSGISAEDTRGGEHSHRISAEIIMVECFIRTDKT